MNKIGEKQEITPPVVLPERTWKAPKGLKNEDFYYVNIENKLDILAQNRFKAAKKAAVIQYTFTTANNTEKEPLKKLTNQCRALHKKLNNIPK